METPPSDLLPGDLMVGDPVVLNSDVLQREIDLWVGRAERASLPIIEHCAKEVCRTLHELAQALGHDIPNPYPLHTLTPQAVEYLRILNGDEILMNFDDAARAQVELVKAGFAGDNGRTVRMTHEGLALAEQLIREVGSNG